MVMIAMRYLTHHTTNMVLGRGLEPPRLTAYAPQAYVYTNFTTRA